MSRTATPRCGVCQFFLEIRGNACEGECHRRPPQIVSEFTKSEKMLPIIGDLISYATRFPIVDADEWCGEFVRKAK